MKARWSRGELAPLELSSTLATPDFVEEVSTARRSFFRASSLSLLREASRPRGVEISTAVATPAAVPPIAAEPPR